MKANTREELRKKANNIWCCQDTTGDVFCTFDCMAWREQKRVMSSGRDRTAKTIWIGWCGLAGQPADEWDMTESDNE